jgi:hypothetical membrane protein
MRRLLKGVSTRLISAVQTRTAQGGKIFIRSLSEHVDVETVLATSGIMGPIIFVAADIILGLLNPGYNFLHSSISSLARTELGWIQTLGFMVAGILVVLFAVGLFLGLRGGRAFRLGIAAMVLFALGLLLVGAFHADPSGGPSTFEGMIHGVAAKLVFWLFPVAVLLMAPSLKNEPFWRPLFFYSLGAAIFALGLMANSLRMPSDFAWFGLFERILVADEIIWVLVMAIWLLRQSIRERRKLYGSAGRR